MNFLKNALLVIISCIVSLLFLEVGWRAVNGQPLLPDRNFIMERMTLDHLAGLSNFDSLLGWSLKPNLSLYKGNAAASMTTGEFGVRMNQAEIRPVPRNAILAVGDSTTAGSEVGDVSSWPAWLERTIGEPVVNGASGGWGTDQMILRAEDMIAKVHPKTIIVSALDQDILRAGYSIFGAQKPYFYVEDGKLVHMNNPVPRVVTPERSELGWARRIFGYSYLVDYVMLRLNVEKWLHFSPFKKVANDPAQVTCLLLQRLKHATDAKGIRLLFVMQWAGDEIARWKSRPVYATTVIDCANDFGIQTLDTWSPLKAVFAQGADKLKALYKMRQSGTIYGHMSSDGNKFIAELVAGALRNPDQSDKADEEGELAQRVDLPVFADKAANARDLTVLRDVPAADGSRSAVLLEDNSDQHGTMWQDFPVADDGSRHTFSIDMKAGTSPKSQIVMYFLGGKSLNYQAYLTAPNLVPEGFGRVTKKSLGNGWYRVTLSGANNRSGNKKIRLQIYPRPSDPKDTGSVYIANARLDP